MSEVKDKAIAKITEEMMKSKNPALPKIEEYLTFRIERSDEVAMKIYTSDKTLQDVFEEIRNRALAKSKNGEREICIDTEEALEIIHKTYGIDDSGISFTMEEKTTSADVSAFL